MESRLGALLFCLSGCFVSLQKTNDTTRSSRHMQLQQVVDWTCVHNALFICARGVVVILSV